MEKKHDCIKLLMVILVPVLLFISGLVFSAPSECLNTPKKLPPENAKKKYLGKDHPIITDVDHSTLISVQATYKQWMLPRLIYDLISMNLNEDDVRTLMRRPNGLKINEKENWIWMPNPGYVSDINSYQDSNIATKIKCWDEGLTMVGWYLPPALFEESPLEKHYERLYLKKRIENPLYMYIEPLFLLLDKIFPIAEIGGTDLKHCSDNYDEAFKRCTFDQLNTRQNEEYLVTLLDLTSDHVDWLLEIKEDGKQLLRDSYNYDKSTDDVQFYFHWPTGAKTTTLHMHMRVNQGRLPTDNARSYNLDDVIKTLRAKKTGYDLVKKRYSDAGRLILAKEDEMFEKMFRKGNASIKIVTNEYTSRWEYFQVIEYDAKLNNITLSTNSGSKTHVINLSEYAGQALSKVEDKAGNLLFTDAVMNELMVSSEKVTLHEFLSANWPNWDGKGSEYFPSLNN